MLGYQGEEVIEQPDQDKPKDAVDNTAAKKGDDKKGGDKKDDDKKKKLNMKTEKSAPISGEGPSVSNAPEKN